MSELTPMDDLLADDLLLDRLAGRHDAGDEPVAMMLRAVAAHADRPLKGRARRRRSHARHVFVSLAVLTVGVSGAGVAAAVTLPTYLPGMHERARVERAMDDSVADDRPSALLSRLGIPDHADVGAAHGLVLVRRADGRILLVPAAAAAPVAGLSMGPVRLDLPLPAAVSGTPTATGNGHGEGKDAGKDVGKDMDKGKDMGTGGSDAAAAAFKDFSPANASTGTHGAGFTRQGTAAPATDDAGTAATNDKKDAPVKRGKGKGRTTPPPTAETSDVADTSQTQPGPDPAATGTGSEATSGADASTRPGWSTGPVGRSVTTGDTSTSRSTASRRPVTVPASGRAGQTGSTHGARGASQAGAWHSRTPTWAKPATPAIHPQALPSPEKGGGHSVRGAAASAGTKPHIPSSPSEVRPGPAAPGAPAESAPRAESGAPAAHAQSGAPAAHAQSGAPAAHAQSGAPTAHAQSGAPTAHAQSGAHTTHTS